MDQTNISIGVKVGESQKQIKSLKDEIKSLGAEFKVASEEIKYTGTESDLLTEKQKMLAAQLAKQQEIAAQYANILQKHTENQSASLIKLEEARVSLANAKDTNDTEGMVKYKEAVENLTKSYANATASVEKDLREVEKAKLVEREFAAQLANVNIELNRHKESLTDVGNSISQYNRTVGSTKQEIQVLGKEMQSVDQIYKSTASVMETQGRHLDALTVKQKSLSDQLKIQEAITAKSRDGLSAQSKAVDAYWQNVEKAANALETAQKKSNTSSEGIIKLESALSEANDEYVRACSTLNEWEINVKKSVNAEQSLKSSLEKASLEIKEQSGILQQASDKMQTFSDNYQRGAQSVGQVTGLMNDVGRGLTVGLTVPLTAAAAASFAAGQEINKNLANIGTLGVGSERLQELKKGIQDIGIAVGKNTTDVAEGTYSIISALGDTSDTLEITAINAKSAAAALATTQEAIKLTTAVTKGYNDITAEATQKASDLAFATLRLGQTTYSELAASIGGVIPASNALKISQEELFNVFATLTGVTGSASEVATQYNSVLTALMKPNKELAALLKEQGYASGFAAVEALGFKGTLDMMVGAVNGSEEALVNLVGRKEAAAAMFALTGAQAEDYARKLKELQNSMGATDAAFAAQSEGVNEAGFSFQQSMVRMQVAAQGFAEAMAPFVSGAANMVEGLTEWLAGLNEEQRNAIVVIGALVAAVGPALSVSSKLITVVTGLQAAFAAEAAAAVPAAGATAAAGSAAGGAAIAFNTLLGPVGLVALALAGVTAGIYAYNKSQQEAVEKVNDLTNAYRDQTNELNNNKKTIDEIKNRFAELHAGVSRFGDNLTLATDAYNEYNEMQRQIAAMFPELVIGYNSEGDAIVSLKGDISDVVAELDQLIERQREAYNQQIINDSGQYFKGVQVQVKDYRDEIAQLENDIDRLNGQKEYKFLPNQTKEIAAFQQQLDKLGIAYERINNSYNGYALSIQFKINNTGELDKYLSRMDDKLDFEIQLKEHSIEALQQKIEAEFKKYNPVINAYLNLDFRYAGFDDQMKELADTLASGLDFDKLNLKSNEDVKKYLEDNILGPLSSIAPQARDRLAVIFDLQEQLTSGRINLDDFKRAVQDQFAHLFDDLDIDTQNAFYDLLKNAGFEGDGLAAVMQNLALSMGGVSSAMSTANAALNENATGQNAVKTAAQEAASSVKELYDAYSAGEKSEKDYVAALQAKLVEIEKITAANPQMAASYQAIADIIRKELAKSPAYLRELRDATGELINETSTLRGGFEEIKETGSLTDATILKLIESGYALALQFNEETGEVTLNTEAVKALTKSKYEALIADNELAQSKLTDELNKQKNIMLEVARNTYISAAAKWAAIEAANAEIGKIKEQRVALEAENKLLQKACELSDKPTSYNKPPSVKSSKDTAKAAAEKAAKEAEEKRKADLAIEKAALQAKFDAKEEEHKNWIDREKFYNRLSYEEEAAVWGQILDIMRQAMAEAENLTAATEEEKAQIKKDYAKRIESYERQQYTANKNIVQESIKDAEELAAKQEKALKKEIDAAEDGIQKYEAYAALRVSIEKKLTDEMANIDEKYWLTEKEKLKEIEAAYEIHVDTLTDIDKKMYDLRKEKLIEYADEWYKVEQKKLEDGHTAKKNALSKDLESIRAYYDAAEAEEKSRDRNKELGDLQSQAAIYQNAATKEGQDKYKSILSQIENLQKEADREARQASKQHAEAAVNARMTSIDAAYKQEKDDLEQRYKKMKDNAAILAQDTALGLTQAADQVTGGLESLFGTYDKHFDKFSFTALDKLKKLASEYNALLGSINFNIGTSAALAGSMSNSVTNNNRTSSVTLNDYGSKNFYSNNDSQSYLNELDLILYNASKRVG